MTVSPQTDAAAYASLTYINTASGTVTADVLNVRSTPEVSSGNIIGQLKKAIKSASQARQTAGPNSVWAGETPAVTKSGSTSIRLTSHKTASITFNF